MMNGDEKPKPSLLMAKLCPTCGKAHSREFRMSYPDYAQIQRGVVSFPEDFTPDDREFVMTGICDECWKLVEEAGDAEAGPEYEQGDVAQVPVLRGQSEA